MKTIKLFATALFVMTVGCGSSGSGTTGASSGTCCASGSSSGSSTSVGPEGPVGPSGPQGLTGLQGPKGATGPAGPEGPQGAKGDTGTQGPAGATGTTGMTGPQGIQGTPGTAGTPGVNGVLSGNSQLYLVETGGLVPANGSATISAKCATTKDIMLNGSCTSSYQGMYILSYPALATSSTPSSWQCNATSGISPAVGITAWATCISVP